MTFAGGPIVAQWRFAGRLIVSQWRLSDGPIVARFNVLADTLFKNANNVKQYRLRLGSIMFASMTKF